jgi:uncharacterized protein (DUF1330 family)
MAAYAIAHLSNPKPHPEIVDYLYRIQATLDPYSGKFIVHGGAMEAREGDLPAAAVVVIQFPDLDAARSWYDSPAYQEILPLRTDNIDGIAFLVEGVAPDHSAAKVGQALSLAPGA